MTPDDGSIGKVRPGIKLTTACPWISECFNRFPECRASIDRRQHTSQRLGRFHDEAVPMSQLNMGGNRLDMFSDIAHPNLIERCQKGRHLTDASGMKVVDATITG